MKSVRLTEMEAIKGERFELWQLLNPTTVGSGNLMLFQVSLEVGGSIPDHGHGPAEAALYVLSGQGEFRVDEEGRSLGPDSGLLVPVGATIGIENRGPSPLRLLVAMAPPISVEVCPVCGILVKERES